MEPKQVGRLAIRGEGQWVKAYYAQADTMKGAILLGMVRVQFLTGNEARKREFMALYQQCVSDLIEEVFGARPAWPEGPQPAPEHERKRK